MSAFYNCMNYRHFVVTGCCYLLSMHVSAQSIIENKTNEELSLMLDEVVVTGTGTEHLLKDVPVQTEVINHKIIEGYGGKNLQDILMMLTSSLDFNQDDMGSQMQLNGLGNNYILILIDGKRIHGDVGGQNDLGLIDPNNIDKIEIVKGASSALYGSDAIAGVINIITKKHDEGILLENTTRVGSYGDIRQHNGIGFRLGRFQSYTNLQLQHTDGWQNTATEYTTGTEKPVTDSRNKTVNRYTNAQVAQKFTYDIGDKLQLYAEGSAYWKHIYRPSGKYAHYDVKTYDLEYHNSSLAGGGKLQLSGTDYITLDVDWNRHAYYYHFTDTTLVDGYLFGKFTHYYPMFPGEHDLQSDQQRTMVNLKGVFELPYENRLSAGLEWRYDWLNAPMRVEGEKVSDWTGALYVQDEFNLWNWLNITGGLRLNKNQNFGLKLTPKISTMFSMGDWRIRATWSEGFKSPTPKELYYRYIKEMNGSYLYMGNPDLKPQTSDYFSLGVEYSWKGFYFNVSGYYNTLNNMITLVTIPNYKAPSEYQVAYELKKTRQYQNMEDAKTYGADVTLRYAHKDWSAGIGYSYLDNSAHVYDTNKDILKKVTIDGTAHHKANAYVTWKHAFGDFYRLGVGVYGRMSTKRYYQTDGDGKGYQIWRINTTHDFGKSKTMSYRLEAGVDNIFDYVDTTPHGRHLGTTTPGRTIYASLTIKFSKGKKTNNKFNSNMSNSEDD